MLQFMGHSPPPPPTATRLVAARYMLICRRMTEMTKFPPDEKSESRIVTTQELLALLAKGKTVRLPSVVYPDAASAASYDAHDLARLDVDAADNPIVSVEYVGEEEVQCIMVEDERHLYITDDFIPTHNTSNIIFLKSTDDSMIETLSKMSGVRHVSYRDSKTVTRDVQKVALQTEGKVSYTTTTKEEPVISYTDLASLPERNSVVFRAGDPPIWNRNETILPMSFALFKNTITHAGHKYTLQTIPTLSSAQEFDVRHNQPDFAQMLAKRMRQAVKSKSASDMFKTAYGYSDRDVDMLDPDVYAADIMEVIDVILAREDHVKAMDEGLDEAQVASKGFADSAMSVGAGTASAASSLEASATDNVDVQREVELTNAKQAEADRKRYAKGTISRDMLVFATTNGNARSGWLDNELARGYFESINAFAKDHDFRVDDDGKLFSKAGVLYIDVVDNSADRKIAQEASENDNSRVFSEGGDALSGENDDIISKYKPTSAFKEFLATQEDWKYIADGVFDDEMYRAMRYKEEHITE